MRHNSNLLRSAVGMTHSLRSDLRWTIPFRALLDHFGIPQKSTKPILALKLSVSATITPGGLPHNLHILLVMNREVIYAVWPTGVRDANRIEISRLVLVPI